MDFQEEVRRRQAKREANEKYINEIKKYYEKVVYCKSLDERINLIKDIYSYVKSISHNFYEDEEKRMDYGFKLITNYVLDSEYYLPTDFIIENNPNFDLGLVMDYDLSQIKEPEYILDSIVNLTRHMLYDSINGNLRRKKDFKDLDLTNFCIKAAKFIADLCGKYNIYQEKILIEPGFIKNSRLFSGVGLHSFNIITLEDKKYLVDCTYSQFFLLAKSFLERIGIPNMAGCNSGVFMTMCESRRRVAENLLRDGFILLEGDVLKDYLDSFAISYRNGLYYEETNDFSYTTNYEVKNYDDFLAGVDNQLNHEKELLLGYQRKPLNNPNLDFSKR